MAAPKPTAPRPESLPRRAPRPPSEDDGRRGARVDGQLVTAKAMLRDAASAFSTLSVSLGSLRPDDVRSRLPALCDVIDARLKELRALIPG